MARETGESLAKRIIRWFLAAVRFWPVIGSAVSGVGVAIWAALTEMPGPYVAVLAIGAFALFAVGALAVDVVRERVRDRHRASVEAAPYGLPGSDARLTITNTGAPARFTAYGQIVNVVRDPNDWRKGEFSLPWLPDRQAEMGLGTGARANLLIATSEEVPGLERLGIETYEMRMWEVGNPAPFNLWRWHFKPDSVRPRVTLKVTIISEPRLVRPFERYYAVEPGEYGGIVITELADQGR